VRVVHVNDIASVGSELVDGLRELGVDASLVDPARPGARIRYPLKMAALPFRALALAGTALRLRRRPAELLHVHYARLGFLGALSGRPYVLHCHGTDIRGVTPRSAWGAATAPWLRRAAHVLYATPDLAEWVHAFRPDATYLPNPIRVPRGVERPGERTDLLVGVRLDPVKGPERIADLLEQVRARRPSTSMTIIANGRDVERVVRAAGANARVVDPVPHAELPRLIAAHRLAVGQMLLGALGNYELEAMACGLPVAAAFSPAVASGPPPPLVGGETAEEMAGNIVGLLDDGTRRDLLGDAARAWVAEQHGAGSVAARLRDIYLELISAAGRNGGAG